jgi:hypothetical protein
MESVQAEQKELLARYRLLDPMEQHIATGERHGIDMTPLALPATLGRSSQKASKRDSDDADIAAAEAHETLLEVMYGASKREAALAALPVGDGKAGGKAGGKGGGKNGAVAQESEFWAKYLGMEVQAKELAAQRKSTSDAAALVARLRAEAEAHARRAAMATAELTKAKQEMNAASQRGDMQAAKKHQDRSRSALATSSEAQAGAEAAAQRLVAAETEAAAAAVTLAKTQRAYLLQEGSAAKHRSFLLGAEIESKRAAFVQARDAGDFDEAGSLELERQKGEQERKRLLAAFDLQAEDNDLDLLQLTSAVPTGV